MARSTRRKSNIHSKKKLEWKPPRKSTRKSPKRKSRHSRSQFTKTSKYPCNDPGRPNCPVVGRGEPFIVQTGINCTGCKDVITHETITEEDVPVCISNNCYTLESLQRWVDVKGWMQDPSTRRRLINPEGILVDPERNTDPLVQNRIDGIRRIVSYSASNPRHLSLYKDGFRDSLLVRMNNPDIGINGLIALIPRITKHLKKARKWRDRAENLFYKIDSQWTNSMQIVENTRAQYNAAKTAALTKVEELAEAARVAATEGVWDTAAREADAWTAANLRRLPEEEASRRAMEAMVRVRELTELDAARREAANLRRLPEEEASRRAPEARARLREDREWREAHVEDNLRDWQQALWEAQEEEQWNRGLLTEVAEELWKKASHFLLVSHENVELMKMLRPELRRSQYARRRAPIWSPPEQSPEIPGLDMIGAVATSQEARISMDKIAALLYDAGYNSEELNQPSWDLYVTTA